MADQTPQASQQEDELSVEELESATGGADSQEIVGPVENGSMCFCDSGCA
jgi:hypothetical protein